MIHKNKDKIITTKRYVLFSNFKKSSIFLVSMYCHHLLLQQYDHNKIFVKLTNPSLLFIYKFCINLLE